MVVKIVINIVDIELWFSFYKDIVVFIDMNNNNISDIIVNNISRVEKCYMYDIVINEEFGVVILVFL